jgi:hypothetical protein
MAPDRGKGHLDIPLVWDGVVKETCPAAPGATGVPRSEPAPRPVRLRLWCAALLDGAIVVGINGVVWAVAWLGGAHLGGGQLVLASLVGVGTSVFLAISCLWVWRATPGMLTQDLVFGESLPLSRASIAVGVWFVAAVALFLPLIVSHGGEMVAEKLAGSSVSCRAPHASA